jgi:hypothetical protein
LVRESIQNCSFLSECSFTMVPSMSAHCAQQEQALSVTAPSMLASRMIAPHQGVDKHDACRYTNNSQQMSLLASNCSVFTELASTLPSTAKSACVGAHLLSCPCLC